MRTLQRGLAQDSCKRSVMRKVLLDIVWGLATLLAGAVTVWLAYGLWQANLDGGGTLFLALSALLTYWCSQHLLA